VEAAWMEYTDGSCCGDKIGHGALPAQVSGWENKGEEIRGCARQGGVRATGSPKEEKGEGKKGGPVRGMRHETQEPTGYQEREKRTVHKDGECGMMLRPHENGELEGST